MNKHKVRLFLLLLSLFFTAKAQDNIDSLEHLLKSAKDTARINILNNLGYALTNVNYKKSFTYTSEALVLSEKSNYIKGEAEAHKTIGYIYTICAEYQEAIEHSNKAYKLFTSIKDEENRGFSLNLLGVIYADLAVYDKALDYYLQAQKVYEQYGIEKKMANVYSNISIIYKLQKREELSKTYLRKAIKIDLKNNNTLGLALDYINFAIKYDNEKQYTKALQLYDSIFPTLKKEQDFRSLGNAYSLFGGIYYNLKNSKKGLELMQLSIKALEKVNDRREILNTYISLARINYNAGDMKTATIWGQKALNLAKQVKRNYSFAMVYKTLTMIAKTKEEYKQAYEYQVKYIQYNDSLKQNEQSQKLLRMQTIYETQAKELQINSLNKENDLKGNQLIRQRLIIALVAISLILSILILLFLLNRYRLKQNANKALELKNNEIEKQKQQIVEINNQLSNQATELKQLDKVKSRFFTNISHEFRTPLTLIISPLEVFLSNTSDEKFKSEYQMMLRQARRLLTLVNQLLELSKLENGFMRLVLSKDDFNRYVRTLTTSYTSLAAELKIELIFEGSEGELNMWFDKDKIEKIITNIITNAFKFTMVRGKIIVEVHLVPQNEQLVEIIIRDTGEGIEPEQLKYIFDPFYQASSTMNAKFQGTGIGLTLVKELVHLHHGTISVQSKPGSGSEFIVQLPINKSAYKDDEFDEAEIEIINPDIYIESNNKPSKKKESQKITKERTIILLVEDNEDMRRYITQNLPNEFQIAEAVNGNDGIEKANEIMPDIIIADIMMPSMDGIEMVKILKTDERTSHIPVVFLTAKASDKNKIEGLETHADDYLTKPFNIRELLLRIQNLIFNKQKLREKFEKSISIIPSELVSNSVDELFLRRALQIIEDHIGDLEYNAEKFCKDMGMSRSNLHRKLIALTNQPVTEFIRTIRLKRAAQLLSNHAASVSEIAYQTGFGNLSYFTKCFKEQFGITPSEYAQS